MVASWSSVMGSTVKACLHGSCLRLVVLGLKAEK